MWRVLVGALAFAAIGCAPSVPETKKAGETAHSAVSPLPRATATSSAPLAEPTILSVRPSETVAEHPAHGLTCPASAPFHQSDGNMCPADGDNANEKGLSLLKNRTDEGPWRSIPFAELRGWTWPRSTEGRDIHLWAPADRDAIAEHNGMTVSVEGYLLDAVPSGSEACNCGRSAGVDVDYHIWLFNRKLDHAPVVRPPERGESIVVEMTPRLRTQHHGWTVARLKKIAHEQLPVRVSGWTFYDPEHGPEVRGSSTHAPTRGTLWEIHPIMKLEVQQAGGWVDLDDAQL